MIKSELLYVIMLPILWVGCNSDSKNRPESVNSGDDHSAIQSYDKDDYISSTSVQVQSPISTEETFDQKMSEDVQNVVPAKISKWYQEGYDQGYEDGEDDALSRNGFHGQYDDECRYKGKKRKEYQLGYAEGYEAGFDDNVANDGSDDEYE